MEVDDRMENAKYLLRALHILMSVSENQRHCILLNECRKNTIE